MKFTFERFNNEKEDKLCLLQNYILTIGKDYLEDSTFLITGNKILLFKMNDYAYSLIPSWASSTKYAIGFLKNDKKMPYKWFQFFQRIFNFFQGFIKIAKLLQLNFLEHFDLNQKLRIKKKKIYYVSCLINLNLFKIDS